MIDCHMEPQPGSLLRRYVGDQIHIGLRAAEVAAGWQARVRTTIGCARSQRRVVIDAVEGRQVQAQTAWQSLPMRRSDEGWTCTITLDAPGSYAAKAYLIDPDGRLHWPSGDNLQIMAHPAAYRSGNTIYCAFTRLFGGDRRGIIRGNEIFDQVLGTLDGNGFAVIPPSGTLRDLAGAVPHIVDRLGCRILHLLPINPTPTTFARYGRYGSPYAALDFTTIDPALIEHDRRTTPGQQFRELVDTVHRHDAKLIIDLAINHTGWGSVLQNEHPGWFQRNPDGSFHSPGAWGVTWEDLSELDYQHRELWTYIAECFLLWCRRGVDGFRCDAGYMVPLPAWQYIIAKVQQRFPDTLFLLEGLGGAWEITESLLTTGGMQWCYSELFQNYDAAAINPYLDYALGQCERRGLWVHYAETHDNDRLAADPDGAAWSLFRNRLCALCSVDGAYGFTAGVEWLAEEKILVHGNTSLNWDAPQHIIDELANVNRLLDDHPCFRDGASCRLHSLGNQRVVVLERRHGEHVVLVLANPDRGNRREVVLPPELASALGEAPQEITGQQSPGLQRRADGSRRSLLPPLSCYCLAPARQAVALDGSAYRRLRAIHTWAVGILSAMLPVHRLPRCDWRELADLADRDHKAFIAACTHLPDGEHPVDLAQLHSRMRHETTPWLSAWSVRDVARELPLPDHHGLVVSHDGPFDVHLQGSKRVRAHRRSVATRDGHVAVFMPNDLAGVEALHLHDIRTGASHRGLLRLLEQRSLEPRPAKMDSCVLLSNGRGAMAWMPVIPHAVTSKYHCALAANLHPDVPMDRHVLIKRLRLWIRHQGFTTPLDDNALAEVQPGPPATWLWRCTFAGGVRVAVRMQADLMHGANTLVLRFEQDGPMPDQTQLIVRVDCEDRSFHAETDLGSNAALAHFRTNTRSLGHGRGFLFQPSSDRRLEVWSDHGTYRAEEEILRRIAHPHEGQRGQRDHGDAWSPGWFELPLDSCQSCCLVATAEAITPKQAEYEAVFRDRRHAQAVAIQRSGAGDYFGQALTVAAQAYVVRRDDGRSVIAGYPWFLDWGRDTLICARGLIAAGLDEEIRGILTVFGRFEENGTLPNAIFGDDARNRDTSDAPLWYGVVCEDLAERHGADIYQTPVDTDGRPIADVLRGIASGYLAGTPNGIRVDADSALVWSPEHFTWMDTSHPAGTPRRGYPVEIQVLWIRLLRLCATLDLSPIPGQADWSDLAARAEAAFHELFWLPELGHHSDCLHAAAGTPARAAVADDALRCNALFGIALGVVSGPHARRAVTAARDWLLVPGAIRSLAPRPVHPPLPIRAADGGLIGDPEQPYRGIYVGDEDSSRKPAYHNGTAWTWPLPLFCEAYARAFDQAPEAVRSARCYLCSMADLLDRGCLGQIPEILDGDAPHHQRGCLAQAWGITEALRVWRLLQATA